jgi:hypothetical protein
MPLCPTRQQPVSKRTHRGERRRQKDACDSCHRFTEDSASASSGYRWSIYASLSAVRRYLAYPLSSRRVFELLAERGLPVSHRTVLNWAARRVCHLVTPSSRSGREFAPRWAK